MAQAMPIRNSDPGRVADERVGLVHPAVEELGAGGQLVVDLERPS